VRRVGIDAPGWMAVSVNLTQSSLNFGLRFRLMKNSNQSMVHEKVPVSHSAYFYQRLGELRSCALLRMAKFLYYLLNLLKSFSFLDGPKSGAFEGNTRMMVCSLDELCADLSTTIAMKKSPLEQDIETQIN
jgi:hypothetical protein